MGAEAAVYQEWGGRDLDGRQTLATYRPGWESPIHQLLVENGVTVVFHGHDHFYARQEPDGVIYQLVPQPAHRNDRTHHAEEYGYKEGLFLPNSGYLRVKVSPEMVVVDYVRQYLPDDQATMRNNGPNPPSNRERGAEILGETRSWIDFYPPLAGWPAGIFTICRGANRAVPGANPERAWSQRVNGNQVRAGHGPRDLPDGKRALQPGVTCLVARKW